MTMDTKLFEFVENRQKLLQEIELPIEIKEKFSDVISDCVFFRIDSLTYEDDFPRLEAFENVVASINKPECRLVYYLQGTENGVSFYVGAVVNPNRKNNLTAGDYEKMLENALKGNFLGTKLTPCRKTEKSNPAKEIFTNPNLKFSTLLGIPSRNKEKDDISFQGVDRLVNIMDGINFHLMVIWEPVPVHQIDRFDNAVKQIYNDVQYISKYSEQVGTNTSVQDGTSEQKSTGESESTSTGTNESKSTGTNESKSIGTSESKSTGTNKSKSIGTSKSDTSGTSSGSTKQSSSSSTSSGQNKTHTKSVNDGVTSGTNSGTTWGTNSSSTVGTNSNTSSGTNSGTTWGTNSNITEGTSRNESKGESLSITHEIHNKHAGELAKYIDDELLPRLRQGKAKGMYRTAVYLGADHSADLALLENAVTSIYQGDGSTFFPLHIRSLPQNEQVQKLIGNFKIYDKLEATTSLLPLYSRPIQDYKVSLATWLTPSEISILAGLPQKEVPGLELREQVGFGLNIPTANNCAETVYLGHMLQEGNDLKTRSVYLLRKDLDKHLFVAGTTGSGKTTTCLRLLDAAQMPFLVIEPAKTEYRILFNRTIEQDIILFTLGNEKGVPFRFNPFEFLPEESLSAHVDILKACFMASFDMEAAIPNLLEEALYKTYEAFGWSFRDNSNKFLEDRSQAWKCNGLYFPTISDYIDIISKVVDAKGFDKRLKDDYLGSIRARLDSLRTGVKGIMLDTRLSVDFEELIDKKVILELEELKSGEDKSFIMGLVLGRLVEALKARHRKDSKFKHITLVEEAHRLLSRPQAGSSPNRMLGVEMFTDMLAEVRKYGESLIIVDQIPNKLAPEVLKNTNTKIIHKLFSRDDKEAIGDAIALDEKQQSYLSQMGPGETIISSQGWRKPINVQVKELPDISTSHSVSEEKAFAKGWEYWLEHPWIYNPQCSQELFTTLSVTQEILQQLDLIYIKSLDLWDQPHIKTRWEVWQTIQTLATNIFGQNAHIFLENMLIQRHTFKDMQKDVRKSLAEKKEIAQEHLAIDNGQDFSANFQQYY